MYTDAILIARFMPAQGFHSSAHTTQHDGDPRDQINVEHSLIDMINGNNNFSTWLQIYWSPKL